MIGHAETTKADIRHALYLARKPVFRTDHEGSGFYAIYLKSDHRIEGLSMPSDGLLYLGMTQSGFARRDHIFRAHSGGCTFRRSVGALLQDELQLKPVPYRPASPKRLYRFDGPSEARLSEWMKGAFNQSRVPFKGDVENVERRLINWLEPPLNLTDWVNPQGAAIRKLRYACWQQTVHEGARKAAA